MERIIKEEGRRGGRKEELSHSGGQSSWALQTILLKSSQNSFSSPSQYLWVPNGTKYTVGQGPQVEAKPGLDPATMEERYRCRAGWETEEAGTSDKSWGRWRGYMGGGGRILAGPEE